MNAHAKCAALRRTEPILARCACGFEAEVPEATERSPGDGLALCEPLASVLERKRGGGWRCPDCGAEPPAVLALPPAEWRRREARK